MKFLFSLIFLFSSSVWALKVPTLTRPVEDLTKVLSESDKLEVEAVIRKLHDDKLAQLSVLIIPSLEEEVLEGYSIKVAETWKLGTEKRDDGVLLLLSMNDRKMRLEVGNGIEGSLADYESARIIDDLKSYLRSGDIKGGLLMVTQRVREEMEYDLPERVAAREQEAADARRKSEEVNQAMAMLFSVLAVIGVWIWSISNIHYSLTKAGKLTIEIAQEKEKLKKESKSLEEDRDQESKLRLDSDKFSYHRVKDEQSSYEDKVRDKKDEISRMKRYLGE